MSTGAHIVLIHNKEGLLSSCQNAYPHQGGDYYLPIKGKCHHIYFFLYYNP